MSDRPVWDPISSAELCATPYDRWRRAREQTRHRLSRAFVRALRAGYLDLSAAAVSPRWRDDLFDAWSERCFARSEPRVVVYGGCARWAAWLTLSLPPGWALNECGCAELRTLARGASCLRSKGYQFWDCAWLRVRVEAADAPGVALALRDIALERMRSGGRPVMLGVGAQARRAAGEACR